ncbi:DUF1634 domain-containing protein [Clostridium luticellarii]|jgi:uncharacterized membrane protein|uniref:DUF1634 domain-containing protein n=1 Tax=Clostridium luticellarii TaxID=1691940 RepID=A0A2T0BA84_9CLOT|nr:DUF1634 domain-containing protein [Clostridium luticellarii]MCI1944258.1 DUF1634 domain-containing protein [Clostridium luticellarii]MCI1967754.1 DUF1634 domain-containing protein [Clostridium luticellarii]MCI1994632.1 DUF1634 domain-containing protein [Clostridium luticellarii]MCI2038871.1 DUF1634 domain-containing protein [Clostridium luticellarii]PRR80811.1 hypothetical protein CLLU_32940 [Clostridium luticellarii]
MHQKKSDDENTKEMEMIIGSFLRIGIAVSSIVIAAGIFLFLLSGKSGYTGDYFPTTLVEILTGSIQFKSYAIILLGLLFLMSVPILRVAISIFVFLKEKDYLYVKITTLVLIILILSFFIGKA